MRTVSAISLSVLLLYLVSSCSSPRAVEKGTMKPRSVEMRWIKGAAGAAPVTLTLEHTDTVRVIIKDSGGDLVAEEYTAVLNAGSYRLESTFAPLVPGAYFVEVHTGGESFVRYVNVKK